MLKKKGYKVNKHCCSKYKKYNKIKHELHTDSVRDE